MPNNRQPAAPKGQVPPPVDEKVVDRQIEDLFGGRVARANEPVPDQFDNFIKSTARSKVAVIVPMYGYWVDTPGFLDSEVLKASVNRISSINHEWYTFVVSEPERLSPDNIKILNGPYVGGNVRGVPVPVGSTYTEYVARGIEVALEETKAQYFIIYNPWGIIQKLGLDIMVERVNLNGASPVVCGYDMHRELQWELFDTYRASAPREYSSYKAKHMLSLDFMGMRRMVAEMCKLDPRYKTQPFAERDFFQQMAMKGFDAVVSERVPTFFFEVPWDKYVPEEWYQEDLGEFTAKWGFRPADIRIK
jgi:hypothetical protein